MVFKPIETEINQLNHDAISTERKTTLQPLIDYIQRKKDNHQVVNLNFICTHNSRRSHLSQVWAQTMASFFNIPKVYCYSGGTETTALFPVVADTLEGSGFKIDRLSKEENPICSIKFSRNSHPIIGFSKTFDADFNPQSDFAAIMTCSSADEACPQIFGAEQRIPITYEDPKTFDQTPLQLERYKERSLQIATEMKYVFSKLNNT
ncbi:arsenate reductase [Winogradskyella epiphytica]|uniref:Arsenate reductase n=1 Tax=Winogradskyella epiphytica TaxID=262005 RepID=A0A2V4XGJ9_9FLAO|nr:protein-tyrosine-phosphatase [Winogradskyella epiphytica]PYE80248.1 arsenate reductase [Winogradskyella epiphytica]GGW70044.1 arsenate reductase [Winogradskyella epiphytica]